MDNKRICWRLAGFSVALLSVTAPAAAGQLELVSRVAPGFESETAAGSSHGFSASADGRYIAFWSSAPNLVPGESLPASQFNVFLYDRVADTMTLVSHAAGAPAVVGEQDSFGPQVSADGRYVAFLSKATDLIAGQMDTNTDIFDGGGTDVFLFDRLSGVNTLVSHSMASPTQTGSGESFGLHLSSDGRYVAFGSFAHNLVAGQTDGNDDFDTFLFDRASGAPILISHSAASATTTADAASQPTGISGDGRYVVFESAATNLIAGPSAPFTDVFLFDRVAGTTSLVSHAAASPGAAANSSSSAAQISADGEWIVFSSYATDLVTGATDANSLPDLFLVERATGTTALVSHAAGASTTSNAEPTRVRISADGSWVAFLSEASDLVAGQVDAEGFRDAFLYERASGLVTLLSHAAGSPATAGSASTEDLSLSADGAYVAFASNASDLVSGQSGPGTQNVFLWERASGSTSLASHVLGSLTGAGNLPSGMRVVGLERLVFSGDGAYLVFDSEASDLVVADRNGRVDAFLYERASGANRALSRPAPGQRSATALDSPVDFEPADAPVPSADGRFVAYSSLAATLVPGQIDANGARDVFLYDRTTMSSLLVSRAAGTTATAANAASDQPDMSADGRFVVFASAAGDLVPGQTSLRQQVFLFDRTTGATALVSRALGTTATGADGGSGSPSISADGNRIAFGSDASDLTPGPAPCCSNDVYVFDRSSGAITKLSRAAGSQAPANAGSFSPRISGDGRYVVFTSSATNLVPGQTHGDFPFDNLYLTEVATGVTVLVNRSSFSPATPGSNSAYEGVLSADGRFVAFRSFADDLVPGQASLPHSSSIFLFDRVTDTNRLVSGADGSPTVRADSYSSDAAISQDGRFVTFASRAPLPGTIDPLHQDILLFDRTASSLTLVSHASESSTVSSNSDSFLPSISGDGGVVAFLSTSTDLVAGQTNRLLTVGAYLYDRSTGLTEVASRLLASETEAGEGADMPRVSADGRHVAFNSSAPGLVANDFNAESDVFLYSRVAVPGLSFFTLSPCRRLDTRQPGQGPALASGARRTIAMTGASCGVPASARAVAVNLTVTLATGTGHLILAPGDLAATPTSSTINFRPGKTRANNATLSLASDGSGTLFVEPFVAGGGTVHLIVDVTGYFE